MKKTITFLLIFSMFFTLTACNKTEAAKAVIKSINSIEEVTLSTKESVYQIEAAYNVLSEEEKKTIKNYDKLLEAKEQVRVLENEDRIQEINKCIGQLDDLTNNEDFETQISKIEGLMAKVDEDYKEELNKANVTFRLNKAIKDYITKEIDAGYPSDASRLLNNYKTHFTDEEKLRLLGEIGIAKCANDAVSDLKTLNYNISFDIKNVDINYVNGASTRKYVNGNNSVEGEITVALNAGAYSFYGLDNTQELDFFYSFDIDVENCSVNNITGMSY